MLTKEELVKNPDTTTTFSRVKNDQIKQNQYQRDPWIQLASPQTTTIASSTIPKILKKKNNNN
jgi:hypothetical protein